MSTTERWTEPQLSPRNPSKSDLTKSWYVRFDFYDGEKWVPIKKRGGINYYKTFTERIREARAYLRIVKNLLEEGWNPLLPPEVREIRHYEGDNPYARKNIADLLEDFFKIKTCNLRKGSVKNYKVAKQYFITWLKETKREGIMPADMSPALAYAFLDYISLKVGPTTWNNYKEAIKILFNMFSARGICDNPFKGIGDKPKSPVVNKPFTPEELVKIWGYMQEHDPYLYVFTLIIYYCYIRPIEITRIQIKEVWLQKDIIYVPGDKSKNKMDGHLRIPSRLKKELLKLNLDQHPADYYLCGRRKYYKKDGIIVQPIWEHRTTITDAFAEILKVLCITDRNLYSFKHTGVVAAYKAGVKIKAIQQQLRHQSLEETDIYMRSLGIGVNEEYLTVDY